MLAISSCEMSHEHANEIPPQAVRTARLPDARRSDRLAIVDRWAVILRLISRRFQVYFVFNRQFGSMSKVSDFCADIFP